jgi:hypothetical protein
MLIITTANQSNKGNTFFIDGIVNNKQFSTIIYRDFTMVVFREIPHLPKLTKEEKKEILSHLKSFGEKKKMKLDVES